MTSALAPRPSHAEAAVLEVAGWRIKPYAGEPSDTRSATLSQTLSNAIATSNLQRNKSLLPVGFCVDTAGDSERTGLLLGLWMVSQSARLVLLQVRPAGGGVAAIDVPIEFAEVIAFEARALGAASARFASYADAAQAYLSSRLPEGCGSAPLAAMQSTYVRFSSCWQSGDIDGLMSVMSGEPSYRTSSGARFDGRDEVRRGFGLVCQPAGQPPAGTPDAGFENVHFFGNRSLSYWSLSLPDGDGELRQVQGVDVITYDVDGRIALKDAYRKVS